MRIVVHNVCRPLLRSTTVFVFLTLRGIRVPCWKGETILNNLLHLGTEYISGNISCYSYSCDDVSLLYFYLWCTQ